MSAFCWRVQWEYRWKTVNKTRWWKRGVHRRQIFLPLFPNSYLAIPKRVKDEQANDFQQPKNGMRSRAQKKHIHRMYTVLHLPTSKVLWKHQVVLHRHLRNMDYTAEAVSYEEHAKSSLQYAFSLFMAKHFANGPSNYCPQALKKNKKSFRKKSEVAYLDVINNIKNFTTKIHFFSLWRSVQCLRSSMPGRKGTALRFSLLCCKVLPVESHCGYSSRKTNNWSGFNSAFVLFWQLTNLNVLPKHGITHDEREHHSWAFS